MDGYADLFGAAVLFVLAIINLFKKDDDQTYSLRQITLGESVTMGFAVGTDAAVANLSLAMQGLGVVAPIVFAVTHYFTVLVGQKLAGKVVMKNSNYLSAAALFILAFAKII